MAKVSNWQKFTLLLWKNYTLQSKIAAIVGIIVACLVYYIISNILVNLFFGARRGGKSSEIHYPELSISTLKLFKDFTTYNNNHLKFELLYSPNTSRIYDSIVKDAANSLQLAGYHGYANAKDLEQALTADNFLAGVQFDDSAVYPIKLAYSLRFPKKLRTTNNYNNYTWSTNQLLSFDRLLSNSRQRGAEDGGLPVGYLREGFLPIQHAISMAYLKLAGKQNVLPEIVMQRYPYPELLEKGGFFLLKIFEGLIMMIIMLSFMCGVMNVTRSITVEKQKQLKEVMKIVGINNWIHWTAWFINFYIVMATQMVILTVIFKFNLKEDIAIFQYSSFTALFVFLQIYIITSICFSFMIAAFFNNPTIASAVTGVLWAISSMMGAAVGSIDMSFGEKCSLSLIANLALGFGLKMIFDLEHNEEGLQWSSLFTESSADDPLSVGVVMLLMLASCVIYMLICLYVEAVFPGHFGVGKKWYFPCTKYFWFPAKHQVDTEGIADNKSKRSNADTFEPEPADKQVGIQVRNLNKQFGENIAVRDVSMNVYEDEITVLLGHNGAGKTTTISMLVGMIAPSSGTAYINGYDIRSNMDSARGSLGMCPQHNVLFDEMTVADHLDFFSRLQGLKGNAVNQEVRKYLRLIQLEDKKDELSSKLSGGMKRKLSLCCALCGNTKVVLCDEPSSGMDPSARRQLWDLLLAEKTGRTLLLTTHFMDEADVLADRIAVMAVGELQCYGTPFFLKKKYGSGYRLICVKREGCNVSEVTSLLRRYIPGISPDSDIGAELSYTLTSSHSSNFENMLSSLEDNSDKLNLNGFGVAVTSMEEVFMKAGTENSHKNDEAPQSLVTNSNSCDQVNSESTNCNSDQMLSKILDQVRAMFLKKLIYTWRNYFVLLVHILLPIIYFFLKWLIVFILEREEHESLPPMKFSLSQYPRAVTVLETKSLTPNTLESSIAKHYKLIATSFGTEYKFESTGSNDFSKYILNMGKTMQPRIDSQYLAAATVEMGKITAWLNNEYLHTAPLSVNLVHNAMARSLISKYAEIQVSNEPLPPKIEKQEKEISKGQLEFGAFNFCMLLFTCYFIIYLIKERTSRSKLLQFVSGVNVWIFWATQLIWDFAILTMLVVALIIVLIISASFNSDGSVQSIEKESYFFLGRIFLFISLFGFAVLSFIYLISYYFSEPSWGYVTMLMLNIFTGIIYPKIHLLLPLISDNQILIKSLLWFFRIFPQFSLGTGLGILIEAEENESCRMLFKEFSVEMVCKEMKECCPDVLTEIICLTVTAVLFFLLVVVREYRILREFILKLWNKLHIRSTRSNDDDNIDDDVLQEKRYILSMSKEQRAGQILVLDNVSKYYGSFLAVNQISLCVKKKECFGLLGLNGAGKTTTFKMMTGDESITIGSGYVTGLNLATDMIKIYKKIGYCPQFDALLGEYTGRETLKIYCLLRSIRGKRMQVLCEELAKSFGFFKYLDRKCNGYSGGTKRKLSAALAVLGSPLVVYLDEPTAGMDPNAKRQLWNMICHVRDAGSSIILTSHSMDEIEALCTRVVIMVNGEFKCIGSLQHLKNKFSKGLVLKIKVKIEQEMQEQTTPKHHDNKAEQEKSAQKSTTDKGIQNVKHFVQHQFPKSVLKEEYQGMLTYYIPLDSTKWSKIFGIMEKNRASLKIVDYSINQASLEEIFLEMAKTQANDKRGNKKESGWCKLM